MAARRHGVVLTPEAFRQLRHAVAGVVEEFRSRPDDGPGADVSSDRVYVRVTGAAEAIMVWVPDPDNPGEFIEEDSGASAYPGQVVYPQMGDETVGTADEWYDVADVDSGEEAVVGAMDCWVRGLNDESLVIDSVYAGRVVEYPHGTTLVLVTVGGMACGDPDALSDDAVTAGWVRSGPQCHQDFIECRDNSGTTEYRMVRLYVSGAGFTTDTGPWGTLNPPAGPP